MTVLKRRLASLRDELAVGERAMQELAARRDELMTAMLRISGAIQVLEELLAAAATDATTARDVGVTMDARGAGESWTVAR